MRSTAVGLTVILACITLGGIVEQNAQEATATPRPAPTATVEPTPEVVLAEVLPYYGVVAPEWCLEDMACWIGSSADGRSDADILRSLADDLRDSSAAYAEPIGEPAEVVTVVPDIPEPVAKVRKVDAPKPTVRKPHVVTNDWRCENEGDEDCGEWQTDVVMPDGTVHYDCTEYARPGNVLGTTCPDGYTDSN